MDVFERLIEEEEDERGMGHGTVVALTGYFEMSRGCKLVLV